MNLYDSVALRRFHKSLIESGGKGNITALGWKSPASQTERFHVLSGIADLNDKILIDAGCGHGDLRVYLENIYPGVHYIGIEKIPALLDVAIERNKDFPDTAFFEGDFSEAELPGCDYIIACGSLSYRNSDDDFIFKTIRKLFFACRKGFAFNLLSKPTGAAIIAHYDPQLIFNYCKQLTADVRLIENYFEDDFTIKMYHS